MTRFIRPSHNDSISIKNKFFSYHPIQPFVKTGKGKLDFKRIFYKHLINGEVVQRKWISYCLENNSLYCSNCMAYGERLNPAMKESKFITGYIADIKKRKSLYINIDRHENSLYHQNSSSSAVRFNLNKHIDYIMNHNLMSKRAKEVETKRKVLDRLISIILFIGRQGIPYRGKQEGIYSLNENGNHGNFLELVKLVSNYDSILKQHIDLSIELSEKNKSKKGRGSLITFLSKHFINEKLIIPIGKSIQNCIVNEIKESKKFSIMIDSTQDISVLDQLAICVRYIYNGIVQERLLSLIVCIDSSGIALFNLLEKELLRLDLSLSDVIACSFDGASNMKGIYNGLQAHLKNYNSNIVYTHCMGHVLNLVMTECTTNILPAEDVFGLVEQSSVFLSDSHKRMLIWTSITGNRNRAHDKLHRLQKIGATRWWSKDKALTSIMDNILLVDRFEIENSKFITFFDFLLVICKGNFNSKTKYMARSLMNNWSKFEIICVSILLIDIYTITSPVSKYLQSKSINYLQAWKMIDTMKKEILKKRNDNYVLLLLKKCKHFAETVNYHYFNEDLVDIEDDFPQKRISKKKRLPGENCQDESRSVSSFEKFKLNSFNVLDTILNSIEKRFVPNENLLRDCYWLDPKSFSNIQSMMKLNDSLKTICELAGVDRQAICLELKQFASQFKNFLPNLSFSDINYKNDTNYQTESSNDTEGEDDVTKKPDCNKCRNCIYCAFVIIRELSFQSNLFCNLFIVYKFILILPSTQVSCERVFSKLKIIKTKLRSTIKQENLCPLMLMAVEKDIEIDREKLIDNVAHSSNLLKGLLI